MIKRIKNYGKKEPTRDAHKVYIICEGTHTEPSYFSFFEGLSSNLHVEVIPPTSSGTDPLKLMKHAEEVFLGDNHNYTVEYEQLDTVWFVIDTDTWEQEGKIQPLREFCYKQNESIHETFNEIKPYTAWNVAQSNPCFEIWLFYHFYEGKPDISKVKEFTSFKDFVNASITGGFNFYYDQARLKDAIVNTENNYVIDEKGSPMLYSSQMYNLGKEIYNFVKTDINRLRNK